MRISDWSSDVCSSDLRRQHRWNRDWRSDRRYDWRSYRERNRSHYRMPRYYNPYRGYGYTRFSIGFSLNSLFYGPRYWINDPGYYRLPPASGGTRWIRHYADALLVDTSLGAVTHGRGSRRERGCQYGWISVRAASLKQ